MTVGLHYAREHFDEIVSAFESGEEVVVARENIPIFKLMAIPVPKPASSGKRTLGAGRGELRVPSDEEWRAMDEEIAREMNDAPLMTSGEI